MARQTTAYVYGSAARQLNAEPARRIEKDPVRQPERRPKPRVKRRVDRLSVLLIVITLAIALKVHELQALEENVDLGEIYKKATRELGMRSATNEQVFTYESKKSTQVRLHK